MRLKDYLYPDIVLFLQRRQHKKLQDSWKGCLHPDMILWKGGLFPDIVLLCVSKEGNSRDSRSSQTLNCVSSHKATHQISKRRFTSRFYLVFVNYEEKATRHTQGHLQIMFRARYALVSLVKATHLNFLGGQGVRLFSRQHAKGEHSP